MLKASGFLLLKEVLKVIALVEQKDVRMCMCMCTCMCMCMCICIALVEQKEPVLSVEHVLDDRGLMRKESITGLLRIDESASR